MRAGQITRLWTQDEISTVQHLYAIGAPVKWIAVRIGRHPQATKSKIRSEAFKRDPARYAEFPPMVALACEEWRQVSTAPRYFISSLGRVMAMRDKPGIILTPEVDKDGYLRVQLYAGGKFAKHYLVSRLVLTEFVGPAPSDVHQAAHNDGRRNNNKLSNLRWATPAENIADKAVHGTWQIGESHPRSIATADDAIAVKRLVAEARRSSSGRLRRGEARRIAADAGVSIHLVNDISRGRAWNHV